MVPRTRPQYGILKKKDRDLLVQKLGEGSRDKVKAGVLVVIALFVGIAGTSIGLIRAVQSEREIRQKSKMPVRCRIFWSVCLRCRIPARNGEHDHGKGDSR